MSLYHHHFISLSYVSLCRLISPSLYISISPYISITLPLLCVCRDRERAGTLCVLCLPVSSFIYLYFTLYLPRSLSVPYCPMSSSLYISISSYISISPYISIALCTYLTALYLYHPTSPISSCVLRDRERAGDRGGDRAYDRDRRRRERGRDGK